MPGWTCMVNLYCLMMDVHVHVFFMFVYIGCQTNSDCRGTSDYCCPVQQNCGRCLPQQICTYSADETSINFDGYYILSNIKNTYLIIGLITIIILSCLIGALIYHCLRKKYCNKLPNYKIISAEVNENEIKDADGDTEITEVIY